jgi:vitamin K-dependent gamma-carboxylase
MHAASNSPSQPSTAPGLLARLGHRTGLPVDIAAMAAFRILFGLLMFAGTVRFLSSGWIVRFYGEQTFFFKYWGFSWLPVPPLWALYGLFAALAVLALCVALGLFYRAAIVLFTAGFLYAQLLDVTNYLNHYYLVVLLGLLMCFLPLHRAWSVDAWRKPALHADALPAWTLYLLRFQVAVVYCFAGLAKFNTDWLLHAQPLNIWLSARTETAILGPFFDQLWMAYAFSWAGFLFDSTIVLWLSWKRTRPYAYAVVIFFHLMTDVLFNIGMFPYIMMLSALIFFPADWPRRAARALARMSRRERFMQHSAAPQKVPAPAPAWARKLGLAVLAGYAAVQILVPLRHYAYPGDVSWNEEGMRFSWKVMLREKHGSITYYVRIPATGKELQITPRRYLDARQEREMAGQPDLILQLAHHIADDFRARGFGDVEVRAQALVSLNGRPAVHMIDPDRDLARIADGLARKDWILPEPDTPPIKLWAHAGRAARPGP